MATNYVQWIPMATYDTAGLTGSYAAMNGSGTTQPVKILMFYNASDVLVTCSFDNSNAHFVIPAGGTLIIDVQTNKDTTSGGDGHWNVKKGQIIYGKGSAGSGNLYISGAY